MSVHLSIAPTNGALVRGDKQTVMAVCARWKAKYWAVKVNNGFKLFSNKYSSEIISQNTPGPLFEASQDGLVAKGKKEEKR